VGRAWESSKSNFRSFVPKLLNATVVLRWDGAPKDAEKQVVLLTNAPAQDRFVAFDAYDDRSLIENSCNREAKEHWFWEHHPKRAEAAVRVHAWFVFRPRSPTRPSARRRRRRRAAQHRPRTRGVAEVGAA
jgi:hypothetical protein